MFSQIGIKVFQEYKTSPLPAIFCVLIESTLSFFLFLPLLIKVYLSLVIVACSESRAKIHSAASELSSPSHPLKGILIAWCSRSSSGLFLLRSLRLTVFSAALQLLSNRAESANIAGISL